MRIMLAACIALIGGTANAAKPYERIELKASGICDHMVLRSVGFQNEYREEISVRTPFATNNRKRISASLNFDVYDSSSIVIDNFTIKVSTSLDHAPTLIDALNFINNDVRDVVLQKKREVCGQ